ncbi:unnamed protein product [Auanema sp. JU1783]|nr:unnamed protein product [Auanema sp. JU1783]
MSIPTFIRDVELIGQQLFDHTPAVQAELDIFVERFEKNERHREFDGILRASHALVEAAETPVEALFDANKMKNLTNDIDGVTERITKLTKPVYEKEHEEYLNEIKRTQKEYADLCRAEAQKKMKASSR